MVHSLGRKQHTKSGAPNPARGVHDIAMLCASRRGCHAAHNRLSVHAMLCGAPVAARSNHRCCCHQEAERERARSKPGDGMQSPAGRDANEVVVNLETDSGAQRPVLRQHVVVYDVRDGWWCIGCVKTAHGGRTAGEPSGCSCGRHTRQEDQIRVVLRTGMGRFATYRRFHCNSRLKSPRAWSTRLPGYVMTAVA